MTFNLRFGDIIGMWSRNTQYRNPRLLTSAFQYGLKLQVGHLFRTRTL